MTDPKKINANTKKYSANPINQVTAVKKLAQSASLEDIEKTGRKGAGTAEPYRTYNTPPATNKNK